MDNVRGEIKREERYDHHLQHWRQSNLEYGNEWHLLGVNPMVRGQPPCFDSKTDRGTKND